jgi:hypothetical protein
MTDKVWTVYTQLENKQGAIFHRTYHAILDTVPKPKSWMNLPIIKYHIEEGSLTEEQMMIALGNKELEEA